MRSDERIHRIEQIMGTVREATTLDADAAWLEQAAVEIDSAVEDRTPLSPQRMVEVMMRADRIGERIDIEAAATKRKLAMIKGHGTSHGRLPLARSCACGLCIKVEATP
jgi:hypothetical protein